jgi:hypothetical protein
MGNLQDFTTTTNGTQDNPTQDDDGGSLTFFTQGEIFFVTLTSFVIVGAAFFSLRKRSRENSYEDDDPFEDLTTLTTDCISSMEDRRLFKGNNGIKPFARGRSWRGNRRPSVDSHTSSSSTTYATAGSASSSGRRSLIGANVSNHYKVAAIDRMREMSVSVSS